MRLDYALKITVRALSPPCLKSLGGSAQWRHNQLLGGSLITQA